MKRTITVDGRIGSCGKLSTTPVLRDLAKIEIHTQYTGHNPSTVNVPSGSSAPSEGQVGVNFLDERGGLPACVVMSRCDAETFANVIIDCLRQDRVSETPKPSNGKAEG